MDTLDVTYPSSGDRQLDYFHVGHCELCCRVWLIFAVSTLWFSHLSIAAFLVVGCWKDQVLMAELEIPEPSLVFCSFDPEANYCHSPWGVCESVS